MSCRKGGKLRVSKEEGIACGPFLEHTLNANS